jgi:hypothetical protein
MLSFQDVDVLDISVERSWNGERIANVFAEIEEKIGKPPSYVLGDNASIITKAVREQQYIHIPDVSHTLAMCIERKYKNDKSFIAYTKAIAKVKNRENMRPVSYLLPPKQRVLARFMNITPCIVWAQQILTSYNKLTKEEQSVFAFIKNHTLIIEELHEVTQAVTTISSYLKSKGASRTTIKECLRIIRFMSNSKYPRVVELSLIFKQYLIDLKEKLSDQDCIWHVSSDIIESCFGKYKGRKSCNPLDGVTRQVLILPILTKLNTNTKKINIDFKQALEMNFLSDLKHWSSCNLTENLTVKRRRVLNAA